MKFMPKYYTVLILYGIYTSISNAQVGNSSAAQSSHLQDSNTASQLLNRVDALIHMFNSGNLETSHAVAVAQQIEARTEFDLVRNLPTK